MIATKLLRMEAEPTEQQSHQLLSTAELARFLDVTPMQATRMLESGAAEAQLRPARRRTRKRGGPSAVVSQVAADSTTTAAPDAAVRLSAEVTAGPAEMAGALAVSDVADILAVPAARIAALIKAGALTAVTGPQGLPGILPEHLEEFIARQYQATRRHFGLS